MKVLLIYYTGTYNTRYLTNEIVKRFSSNDEVNKVEYNASIKAFDTNEFDLIGIGYPIYAWNAPDPFVKFIESFSFKEHQKYFIYKNSGETLKFNNASSRKLIKHFNKFNMELIGEYHYIMPYNIRFPYDKKFIEEILYMDNLLLDIMFYNFKHNIVNTIKHNMLHTACSKFFKIQAYGATLNSYFYKVDKDKCIKCMKCVNNCPNNNIKLVDGLIKFGHNCNMCMRCSFYCPVDAINIGMLNHWKVTSYFDFDKELNNCKINNYINNDSKGFYKCFIETFNEIKTLHDQIFNKK